jgi:flagellar hook-length control protein FliK
MKLVTPPTAPANANLGSCLNVQGSIFRDVFNSSVEVAELPNIDANNSPEISAATSDSAPTPAATPTADANLWIPTVNVLQAQAQSIDAEGDTPVQTEQNEGTVQPAERPPAPLAIAPILLQGSVAVATPSAPAAPQLRKKGNDIASGPQGVDLQLMRSGKLANASRAALASADVTPSLSDTLVAPLLDRLGDTVGGFETRFGIGATATALTTVAQPASTPIAELRQLVLTQDGEWIGALARDIVGSAGRDNQLQFRLMPENLGQLDVALSIDNGHVDIRLETSSNAAAQIISADQARLIDDLRNAGLKLGQFDMSNRQNGNGQQRPTTPERQNLETISTSTQSAASSRAAGRFA